MARITSLVIYPIKSCRGVAVPSASIAATGLAGDREWMLVDGDGQFLTQREHPRLALVNVALETDGLRVAAQEMPSLRLRPSEVGEPRQCVLFGETVDAVKAPAEASSWFSSYLGHACELVRVDPGFHRKGGVQYPERDDAPTTFVDNYGVLLLSQASLEDLNRRLPSAAPMNRFRPNIVVDTLGAYEEEFIETATLGEVKFQFTNVCTRCNLTTVDQATGIMGEEPFRTLSSYRFDENLRGVRFGAYLSVTEGIGRLIALGDELSADLAI